MTHSFSSWPGVPQGVAPINSQIQYTTVLCASAWRLFKKKKVTTLLNWGSAVGIQDNSSCLEATVQFLRETSEIFVVSERKSHLYCENPEGR